MATKTGKNNDECMNFKPINSLVTPMLTDMYQVSMAYSYFKMNRHECLAVFDVFFRKNPFKGEYTVFAGLEEVLALVHNYRFSEEDLEYLKSILPNADEAFFDYLRNLTTSGIKIYALKEGSVVFPRIPVMRLEGPLALCQLLETPLLNLMNYASLITTNATRFCEAAKSNSCDKVLIEFGLRRAQGPDGAISASRYSYMGGFDGSSNILSGKLSGGEIPIKGTHAHSFVQSYTCFDEITNPKLGNVNFLEIVLKYRLEMKATSTNTGELAAFVAYALSFKDGFLALVDTYDTLKSGTLNFLCVALALHEVGCKAIGIRLDSGDLSYLSLECRRMFEQVADRYQIDYFRHFNITVSNDINELVLNSLQEQGHSIDTFGIGTNLVTCQAQPALGMVFKLVELEGKPRIKLSQEVTKVTIPCRKEAFRLFGKDGYSILDIMVGCDEETPKSGTRLLCRHPFNELARIYVTPNKVVPLHHLVWDGTLKIPIPSLSERREFIKSEMNLIRADVLRPLNPTPYKVSVSSELYSFIHDLWMKEFPVKELE